MSKDTERTSPPLHIHVGNRMLDDAAREVANVMRRAEQGESVSPQCHLSFEGWGALAQALRAAGLDEQACAAVTAAFKGMAGSGTGPWGQYFDAPGVPDSHDQPRWPRPTLLDLLGQAPSPNQQDAEGDLRQQTVAAAGGDAARVTVVKDLRVPWIGMGDDGRFEVVEDAAGRRFLLLHDWGDLTALDPAELDRQADRLRGQLDELAGLQHLLDRAGR